MRQIDQPCYGLPQVRRGRLAAAPHRPTVSPAGPTGRSGRTVEWPPAGAGWQLCRTDRPCDGLPPADGAGWRLRRTDKPWDDLPRPTGPCGPAGPRQRRLAGAPDRSTVDGLPPAERGRVAAAPVRRTVRRPPAGPSGHCVSCAGPTDRGMASRRCRLAAVPDRPSVRRPPAGRRGLVAAAPDRPWTASRPPPQSAPTGTVSGYAEPIDRATASGQPDAAGWRLRRTDRPRDRRTGPIGGCARSTNRATASRR